MNFSYKSISSSLQHLSLYIEEQFYLCMFSAVDFQLLAVAEKTNKMDSWNVSTIANHM